MREIRPYGSMSGEGKRSGNLAATAPLLDSTHVWAMLEGRGFTGCGKNLQCCHPECSEGYSSVYFQGNTRFFAAAPLQKLYA